MSTKVYANICIICISIDKFELTIYVLLYMVALMEKSKVKKNLYIYITCHFLNLYLPNTGIFWFI